jgi:hypothetical protein
MAASGSNRVVAAWTERKLACAEQLDTGAAIHTPFRRLRPVDLPFGFAVARSQADGVAEVLSQIS